MARQKGKSDPVGDPPAFNASETGRPLPSDPLVSALFLGGEALAGFGQDTHTAAPGPAPATPKDILRPSLLDDFQNLAQVARSIHAWIEADSCRRQLLEQLPRGFAGAEAPRLLFRNLFSEPAQRKQLREGEKALLSRRQIEILREAACDRSHEEIAQKLDIAPRTVATHLAHIYKKLGVSRPLQAVARAVALGYLEMDAVTFLSGAASCSVHDYGAFAEVPAVVPELSTLPDAERYRTLATFGLLLMVFSGTAAHAQTARTHSVPRGSGIVCELDARGQVVRRFGQKHLHWAKGIAVAPPPASRHGFTPGNLFVIDGCRPVQGLSDMAIAEFTPEGEFVRSFTGGREIGTRLINHGCLAFHPDGRLLVTSGGWTDAILAFEDGGRTVRRFAHLCCPQLCIGPSGQIFAIQHSGTGCRIQVLDSCGKAVGTFGGTPAGVGYGGIAVCLP